MERAEGSEPHMQSGHRPSSHSFLGQRGSMRMSSSPLLLGEHWSLEPPHHCKGQDLDGAWKAYTPGSHHPTIPSVMATTQQGGPVPCPRFCSSVAMSRKKDPDLLSPIRVLRPRKAFWGSRGQAPTIFSPAIVRHSPTTCCTGWGRGWGELWEHLQPGDRAEEVREPAHQQLAEKG